jgi:hypothetical protein
MYAPPPEVLHARPAEGCRSMPNVDGVYRRWAWHVPRKAYILRPMATNGLSSIWGQPSWSRPSVMTSSWRHLIVSAWVNTSTVSDDPKQSKWRKENAACRCLQYSSLYNYTSKFDLRYLGPGSSDRHEFSLRQSPHWDKVRCEVWLLSTERKIFSARGYFVIYGVCLFNGNRHGTAPENFVVSGPPLENPLSDLSEMNIRSASCGKESTCQISFP